MGQVPKPVTLLLWHRGGDAGGGGGATRRDGPAKEGVESQVCEPAPHKAQPLSSSSMHAGTSLVVPCPAARANLCMRPTARLAVDSPKTSTKHHTVQYTQYTKPRARSPPTDSVARDLPRSASTKQTRTYTHGSQSPRWPGSARRRSAPPAPAGSRSPPAPLRSRRRR
jgi:hypothetical protein